MNDFELIDDLDKELNQTNERPSMVLVMCILTFIGCFFSLIFSFYYVIFYVMLSSVQGVIKQTGASKVLNTGTSLLFWQGIIGFICAGLCVWGAVLMLKMRKKGFAIYAFGQVFSFVLPLYMLVYGASKMQSVAPFMGLGLLFTIVPIVFLILHGVNVNKMR
jgi:hypothetical protein